MGKLVGSVENLCSGAVGGRPNLAQASGKDASKLCEALDMAKKIISKALSS